MKSFVVNAHPVYSCDIFTTQRVGGVSRYFIELRRALREQGVASSLIAPLHMSSLLSSSTSAVGLYLPPRLSFKGASRIARTLGAAAETVCVPLLERRYASVVVHRTYYASDPKLRRPPTAVTVYDMIHETFPEQFPGSQRTTRLKRLWCEKADVVLAISHWTKKRIVDMLGVDPSRIVVSHLGTTTVQPDDETSEMLVRDPPFVLFVGARHGYKNFAGLAKGFAQSAARRGGVRLVAFGGGQASAGELAMLRNLGVIDEVHFTAGDDARLAAYYAHALGLLYPSLDEGFGLPPLEAMSHGCPVAASKDGAVPEVVGNAALMFDGHDPGAIADALDGIVFDTEVRNRNITRGRERSAAFDWGSTAEASMSAYAVALANAAVRA